MLHFIWQSGDYNAASLHYYYVLHMGCNLQDLHISEVQSHHLSLSCFIFNTAFEDCPFTNISFFTDNGSRSFVIVVTYAPFTSSSCLLRVLL